LTRRNTPAKEPQPTDLTPLRPTCLEPEDAATVSRERRLSVLCAEALGYEVRRRTTILPPHGEVPGRAATVYDWLDTRGAPAWKPVPGYASDIGTAWQCFALLAANGYAVELRGQQRHGPVRYVCEVLWPYDAVDPAVEGGPRAADGVALEPAEALALAFLRITGWLVTAPAAAVGVAP
jgi:hypothetical protein